MRNMTKVFNLHIFRVKMASLVAQLVKNQPVYLGDTRDKGSIPELGRCPGVGNGNPLHYFCLGSPMDRGTWWATVHQSWT